MFSLIVNAITNADTKSKAILFLGVNKSNIYIYHGDFVTFNNSYIIMSTVMTYMGPNFV